MSMPRALGSHCLLVWLALPISPPRAAAQSGEVCISPAVEASLGRCETRPATASGAPPTAPTSHLPSAPSSVERTRETPEGPSLTADRAIAPHAQERSGALLDREITTLERIVQRLDPADPRGADYLFRLAESHLEAERGHTVAARARDEAVFAAERAGDDTRAASLRAEQASEEARATTSREGAIRAFARILEDYPSFSRADEVLFSLAASLEDLRQMDRARQVYLRLVRDHPGSRFVPYAWLAFGEHYFAEGDMSAARQFYERVLETPPERNPMYGFALYKLAWVHYNLEDFRTSLATFTRVLDHTREHPDARDAEALARQARRELVMPYARVGRPPLAVAFFRRQARSEAEVLEMLESLASLYVDTGQWPESIATHHLLMAEAPSSDHLCAWQTHVTEAVIASRPKPEQRTEIERLLDVQTRFTTGTHPVADVTACRTSVARVTYETAVAWHREAVGTDSQPGTRDRRTMTLAASLYDLALSIPDLASIEMPGIDREDWPTPARVAYARAELAYATEDWAGCGPAFDRVVELEPNGTLTDDAAYASVLCWDHVYQTDYEPREGARAETTSLAARDLTEGETRMLAAFARFACVAPASADLPQVQYRRARVYYEANHFEEAASLFRSVAFDHPTHELAEFAANLYLDSLNGMLRRDARASCESRIAADLEPLAENLCATADARDAHSEACEAFVTIRCGLLRRGAEALGAAGRHREAATAYVSIVRSHGECADLDEVLYDAAIHYEAARLLGRAIRVRQVLVERFPDRPLARPALYQLGANYHALAIYPQAAEHYERYARRFPEDAPCPEPERAQDRCPQAHVALETAVFFRLGLGEEERALEDARLYERSFRRTRPRETAQVVFSLGSIHERRGDWARVFSHYHAFLRDYGRTALPHEILRAHVQLGRAQWEQGRREESMPHFRAAESAWTRLAPMYAAPAASEGDAIQRARAAEAASEALFHLAELAYLEFTAVRFPRFSGPATLARVQRWSGESLGPWLQRKIAALRQAETQYGRIEPLGIPEWRIAAAERVGEMFRSIVDDVRTAPVPEEIAAVPELLDAYEDTLEALLNGSSAGGDGRWDTEDDVRCPESVSRSRLAETADSIPPQCAAAPISRAMLAFEHCLGLATRVRWFNEWSSRCESALNELDRREYPLAAELRGTASYSSEELESPDSLGRDGDLELAPAEDVALEAPPTEASERPES
ncbi:MAG: tetratricopeptide repeat protein [Deltaproteobacteria bacterium]|nr:tetratricopeptide repeat protein [Deltaproteobacteria bacterium]